MTRKYDNMMTSGHK